MQNPRCCSSAMFSSAVIRMTVHATNERLKDRIGSRRPERRGERLRTWQRVASGSIPLHSAVGTRYVDPMDTYRIFVSSPGDAHFERLRVDRVVARLNGELAGAVRLVTVRWETAFYSAHDTFQAQIPLSTDCNIVVAIFRSRLGTELPPDFPRMADGEPYPSGTAYEVLTAIARRQQGSALPDVFVFRCAEVPTVRVDDEASEAEVRR